MACSLPPRSVHVRSRRLPGRPWAASCAVPPASGMQLGSGTPAERSGSQQHPALCCEQDAEPSCAGIGSDEPSSGCLPLTDHHILV